MRYDALRSQPHAKRQQNVKHLIQNTFMKCFHQAPSFVALCIAFVPALALAQNDATTYPAKTVRFIVPQVPGGATDVFARAVGQRLSERWGRQVVVENRGGAGGTLGTDIVAKSPADGYTLLVTYAGSQAINQSLFPKLSYDSVRDFQTVATLAVTPFLLIVNNSLPAKSLKDFIALARARPDAMTYASSGNGSVNHLLGEMLKIDASIRMVHVPYKGVAPAITDVIAGQVEAAFTSIPSVIQHVASGRVRAIAVTSAQRVAIAPTVPTIAESGLRGFDVNPWWGILAPAGVDARIVRKINSDVADIQKTREMQEFFKAQGADALITTPEAFQKLLISDVDKWSKVVKASNARID
jgi:tripartite-type tricarboxylate transporter receptor subunit TctC